MTTQYFIKHVSFWENATPEFDGPFASRAEAESAIPEIEKRLGVNLSPQGNHPADIKNDRQYTIKAASAITPAQFAAAVRDMYDSEESKSSIDTARVTSKRLQDALKTV